MALIHRARVAACAVAAITTSLAAVSVQTAAAADPTYTVTVGAKGTWTQPDDTPAGSYIDKDGTYWFQQAHSLYGTGADRKWSFYSGTNIDSATRSGVTDAVNASDPRDSNSNTTWRCNSSPTGLEATNAPTTGTYSERNYCDLAGVWVDPDTGNWVGLVHNEFTPQPFGDGIHFDAIDYAISTDQGKTWDIKDHVITSPHSTKRNDAIAFPQQTYDYGDGDPRMLVDAASGYVYAFYGSRIVDKGGSWGAFYSHVARAPISGKLAKGTWQKWYGGSWSEPGLGGKESNMVPLSPNNTTGYTPTAEEYDPLNPGSVSTQVSLGLTPPTSPLFVMDVTWNAHLGLYIGEPQAVDQSGNAPQQYYATDNLATQKWRLIGDTGSYQTASWYRWFIDSVSKTGSGIVGKDFRSYCSFGCSNGSSSEYVNVTINTNTPATPVDTSRSYHIGAGGRVLAQVPGSTATTSVTSDNDSATWVFTSNGDGSYRISNTTSRQFLGVGSTSPSTRAWGTSPAVTDLAAGGPTVGQQWFVVPGRSATDGTLNGTYRIVNRYSGLVIGLSGNSSRLAETTPVRFWTDVSGSSVGGGRTSTQQTITLTPVGVSGDGILAGIRTLVTKGRVLDVPNPSTSAGTQLDTAQPSGGTAQQWQFTATSDGYYTMANVGSGLCADIDGGSVSAGARVIQWSCTGGANQKWSVEKQPDGTYVVRSLHSGLLLTTASSANGSLVTQQSSTGADLQHWSIG